MITKPEECHFDSLITTVPSFASKILQDPDYTLVKSLLVAQHNFLITDPSLPDNPITYASQGFIDLTGYSRAEILGRNCRFLQGPETDYSAVDKIRDAIEEGKQCAGKIPTCIRRSGPTSCYLPQREPYAVQI